MVAFGLESINLSSLLPFILKDLKFNDGDSGLRHPKTMTSSLLKFNEHAKLTKSPK